MKLSQMLQKLSFLNRQSLPASRTESANKVLSAAYGEENIIIIKENKKDVLIKCWNCEKEQWVKKGFRCAKEGLCSRCVGRVK